MSDTAEKVVFQSALPDNSVMKLAVKIFRKKNSASEERIDQEASAILEWMLYLIFKLSTISKFIPENALLVEHRGRNVGVAVGWKDGNLLADYYPRKMVPKNHFDALEFALLELPLGCQIGMDCISELNLMWDGQQLWLAEVQLAANPTIEAYTKAVKSSIKILRENYQC